MDQAIKSAVIVIVFVIAFALIILIIRSVLTGERLANQSCKVVTKFFDPVLWVLISNAIDVSLRPSDFICDTMVPF